MGRESRGRELRDLARDSTVQIPGAFNALVARMIETAGRFDFASKSAHGLRISQPIRRQHLDGHDAL